MSKSTVGRWETGKSLPDVEELYWLCKALQCSPEQLLRTHIKDNSEGIEYGSDLSWRVNTPYTIRFGANKQRSEEDIANAVEIFRLIAQQGMGFDDIQHHSLKFRGFARETLRQLVKVALFSSVI